jgi:Tol biopolymer transport system component
LYIGPSSRAGAETPLLETANVKVPQDWSKDGRFLLYFEIDPRTGHDLWALPMTGPEADRKPFPVVKTSYEEQNGQFSPDGSLLAYETNESGRFEIVVQAFPEAKGKWQVSTGGGVQPRWRADGRELFFLAPDGNLMATSVTTTGGTLVKSAPVALFPARVTPVGGGANKQQYVVSRDGRFLINQSVERSAAPIMLILNWKPPAR